MMRPQNMGSAPSLKPKSRWRHELRLWRRWARRPIHEFKVLRHLQRFNRSVERMRRYDRAHGLDDE